MVPVHFLTRISGTPPAIGAANFLVSIGESKPVRWHIRLLLERFLMLDCAAAAINGTLTCLV
jgi:hypothetical protein